MQLDGDHLIAQYERANEVRAYRFKDDQWKLTQVIELDRFDAGNLPGNGRETFSEAFCTDCRSYGMLLYLKRSIVERMAVFLTYRFRFIVLIPRNGQAWWPTFF